MKEYFLNLYEAYGSLAIYFLGINVIAFLVYGLDKYKAIRHEYRISEKNLFLLALVGGSLGAFLAMHIFRHKTRKPYFAIGIPVILIIQLVLSLSVVR